MRAVFLFMYCIFWTRSLASNVLFSHSIVSGSHEVIMFNFAEELVKRGYNVTFLKWKTNGGMLAKSSQNLTVISMESVIENNTDVHESQFQRQWYSSSSFPIDTKLMLSKKMLLHCSLLLENKMLIKYMNATGFDVVVSDLFLNECSLALTHQLGIPSIGYLAFVSIPTAETTIPDFPSYMPVLFTKNPEKMDLFQRVYNLAVNFVNKYIFNAIYFNEINQVIQKHFPWSPSPTELLLDLDAVLINTNPVFQSPRPLPPTFVNIGGIQIRERKKLSQELEEWMDESGDAGVIFMSMGFNLLSTHIPDQLHAAFMTAFSKLNQRVLIVQKTSTSRHELPANVRTVSWLPQQDALGHPKTRIFITHCGINGLQEAIHHAVPVVGLPVFTDQADNMVRVLERGLGVGPLTVYSTEDEILTALQEVLSNPIYKDNIAHLSTVYRDHLGKHPLNMSIDLLEYIIRHKGAPHLKLPIQHLNELQLHGYDVMAFIVFLMAVLIAVCQLFMNYLSRAVLLICAHSFQT